MVPIRTAFLWALAITPSLAFALPQLATLPTHNTSFESSWLALDTGSAITSTRSIDLPNEGVVPFAIAVERDAWGVGIHGESANKNQLVIYVANGDIQSADVFASAAHYRLIRFEDAYYWVDAADIPAVDLRELEPVLADDLYSPARAVDAFPAARAKPDIDGNYRIDVLALYTPTFRSRFDSTNSIAAEFARLIFLANSSLQTSSIPVRYQAIGSVEYDGTDESFGFYENLDALADDDGVTQLRDEYAADLIVLLRTTDGDPALCGLSAGFNLGDHSDPPQKVNPNRDGLLVAGMGPGADGSRCADVVFAHELAHNLSAGHEAGVYIGSLEDLPVYGPYWKSYAHAWQCDNGNLGTTYSSIMSTGSGTWVGALGVSLSIMGYSGPRGNFYSTPDLTFGGLACGLEGNGYTEVGEADNARAMTEAAPYVAAYREKDHNRTSRSFSEGRGGSVSLLWNILLLLVLGWSRQATRKGIAPAALCKLALTGLALGSLAACTSSHEDSLCNTYSGSASALQASTTAGASIEDTPLAFDGQLSTAATLSTLSGAGSATLTAPVSDQNTGYAGILLQAPEGQITQVTITTRRDGEVVDSGVAGTSSANTSYSCPGACRQRDGQTFFGIATSSTYDSVEAQVQISGAVAPTALYEICSLPR